MDEKATGRYQGDFVAWNGGCMFIGSGSGVVSTHSHYAIQLVMGMPEGPRVRFGSCGPWQSCAGAIVPSRAQHSIDVIGCDWSTVLFVEPDTPEGRALTQRLVRAWRTEKNPEAVSLICTQFVTELTQTAPRDPSDPRVLAAIDFIRKNLDTPITLAEVAAASRLSPGRFRHLFVAETGMPLRTYLLWRRFLKVWGLLMRGHSLSAAAHAVGFADSAHLSRTSRTMFGLAPSAMQMKGPLSEALRDHPHSLG